MKLNNRGWGLTEMLVISAILLLILIFVAIMIYSLYNKLGL